MSFPLTVTVTSMTTTPQFYPNNNIRNNSRDSVPSTTITNHHNHNHQRHNSCYVSNVNDDLMIPSTKRSAIVAPIQNSNNQIKTIMISPPPPLSIPLPSTLSRVETTTYNMIYSDNHHRNVDDDGNNNNSSLLLQQPITSRTRPNVQIQRKQSVFVAPGGLSSIRENYAPTTNMIDHYQLDQRTETPKSSLKTMPMSMSDEDISQRISKLIQENKAIVDNNAQTLPLMYGRRSSTSGYSARNHQQQNHSTSSFSTTTTTTTTTSTLSSNNYVDGQYPVSQQLTYPAPIRRHSSSMDNRIRHRQQNVIIRTGDYSSSSPSQQSSVSNSSVPYSKLQSALLGDRLINQNKILTDSSASLSLPNYHHDHHSNHNSHSSQLTINPNPSVTIRTNNGSPNSNDVMQSNMLNMRKYSENVLPTWINYQHYQHPNTICSLNPNEYLLAQPRASINNHQQNESSQATTFFPSLYQQHSFSSSPSVIINPIRDQSHGGLLGGAPRIIESQHHQQSDPKSCLVRNLLLNSNNNSQKRFLLVDDGTGFGGSNNSTRSSSSLLTDLNSLNRNNALSGSIDSQRQQRNPEAQSCIIKDLLLKSSPISSVTNHNNPVISSEDAISNNNANNNNSNSSLSISESHLPPRKRSRVNTNPNIASTTMTTTIDSQQQLLKSNNNDKNTINLQNQSDNQPNHQQQEQSHPPPQPAPSLQQQNVHMCQLCLVSFRSEQNLEIHQKLYCSGQKQQTTAQIQQPELLQPQQDKPIKRERKVSVLERPSIITYTNDSAIIEQNSDDKVQIKQQRSQKSSIDSNSGFSKSIEDNSRFKSLENYNPEDSNKKINYNFGNILKSKLLSGHGIPGTTESLSSSFEQYDDDNDDEYRQYNCPHHPKSVHQTSLKKRKISEPAFRYNPYSESQREAKVKQYRTSVLKSTTSDQHHLMQIGSHITSVPELEIIPAYMPCLMRPPTKITVKGPILLPVLQKMVDTCTNFEFIVDDDLDSIHVEDKTHFINESSSLSIPKTRFLIKQEQEIIDEQQIHQLIEDLLTEVEQSINIDECLSNMIDAICEEKTFLDAKKHYEKISDSIIIQQPQRPKTLALQNYLNYSRDVIEEEFDDNDNNNDCSQKHENRQRKISILVNQCSWIQNSEYTGKHSRHHQLIPSTLVSPDTPRPKQKYQQLFLNGNAYSNLGLKVSLRPTYCCIYRLQPMFVMQEANPQLSMYSKWTTYPIPDGDVLNVVKTPKQLLSAYNSQEAVFVHTNRNNSNNGSLGKKNHAQPFSINNETSSFKTDCYLSDANQKAESTNTNTTTDTTVSIDEFLRKIKLRLNYKNLIMDDENNNVGISSSDKIKVLEPSSPSLIPSSNRIQPIRILKSITISNGDGRSDRVLDSTTKSYLILTPSNFYQSQQQQQNNRVSNTNKKPNNRRISRSIIDNQLYLDNLKNTMGICSHTSTINSSLSSIPCCSMISDQHKPISNNMNDKLDRKSSSSSSLSSCPSASLISNILPTLNSSSTAMMMHGSMFPELPSKSEQAILYIMMLSQTQPSLSVPTVSQIMSTADKNLAFRKFSDCIGLKQQNNNNRVYDQEHGWRFGNQDTICDASGSSFTPKRIKIFEGGFKSNEDYTYIRGRGRGKYMCGECGIRCKKPSMLKKHIRTHTDLRPYSCRYCAFAFKTKGNLTKHMKSKAHHKKCVEMGIVPVPTSIDDSQIDMEALNKQEQYELNCNQSNGIIGGIGSGSLNQFGDEDDDEYDDDYVDEEDDDDEGVPIPMIQQHQLNQNRLTYIEPGQFDDAEDSNNIKDIKRKLSESINKSINKTTRSLSSTSTINHQQTSTTLIQKDVIDSNCNRSLSISSLINPIQSGTTITANQSSNAVLMFANNQQQESVSKPNIDNNLKESDKQSGLNHNRIIDVSTNKYDNHTSKLNDQIIESSLSKASRTNLMIENDTKFSNLMISCNNTNDQLQKTSSYHHRSPNNSICSERTNNDSLANPLNQLSETRKTIIVDENAEAEAVRSLLLLSSGVREKPLLRLPQQQPQLISINNNDKSSCNSHDTPPIIEVVPSSKILNSETHYQTSPIKNSVVDPNQTSTANRVSNDPTATTKMTCVPEFYGHDSAMLKQVFTNNNESLQHSVIATPAQSNHNYHGQQSPTIFQHQTSHPTSVIITNHQSSRKEKSTILESNNNYNLNRKRIRTISNSSNNSSGSNGDQQSSTANASLKKSTSNNLQHSVTTMITTTTPSIITQTNNFGQHHLIVGPHPTLIAEPSQQQQQQQQQQVNGTTQQKLLQKIYSNLQNNTSPPVQQQQIVGSYPYVSSKYSKEDILMINNHNRQAQIQPSAVNNHHPNQQHSLRVHQQPPPPCIQPSISNGCSSNPRRNNSTSPCSNLNSTSMPPLPTIVEQSLNRYVAANNTAASTITINNSISSDQDQPIDLSSKKSSPPTTTTTVIIDNNSKPLHITTTNAMDTQMFQCSSSPTNRSVGNKSIKSNSIKNYDPQLTEQIAQQFSGFDSSVMVAASSGFNDDNNNRQNLYQSIRSEEFAHSMPGVRTPHSISKTIPHVLMHMSNQPTIRSPSTINEQTSSSRSIASNNINQINGIAISSSFNQNNKNDNKNANQLFESEGKPTCPTCMKQFSKPEQLTLHIRIHSFERLFRCEPCRISFRSKGHLQKHTRSVSHMNKLNMNKIFGRPSTDNPRPFKCMDCKTSFRIHGHLAKHLRSKLHIMKLECLGKVPFGMFAEMERNDINLAYIDTTDCDKALETLQLLSQKLYDPRQKCWKDNVDIAHMTYAGATSKLNNDNNNNKDPNDQTSPIRDEDSNSSVNMNENDLIEVLESDDCSSSDGQPIKSDQQEDYQPQNSLVTPTTVASNKNINNNLVASSPPQASNSISTNNTTTSSSLNTGTTIVSTRSNTCHICGLKGFKAAKFLQVHLYCEHPDINDFSINNNTACTSSTTVATSV